MLIPLEPYQLQRAFVFELCFDPEKRVTLRCQWTDAKSQFFTVYHSPQVIAVFNPELPPFKVFLHEDDRGLVKETVIRDVVFETMVLQHRVNPDYGQEWKCV